MIAYIDFRPLVIKISELVPLSVVTADKAYDSEEDNHATPVLSYIKFMTSLAIHPD